MEKRLKDFLDLRKNAMNPYVLAIKRSEDLIAEFKKVGVDWAGMALMQPKAFARVVKLRRIASFLANILKQEMLSLGGDVAVSRGSITGRETKTDCLVMGNLSQFEALVEKLKKQPFGLSCLGQEIRVALKNFNREDSVLNLAGQKIHLAQKTLVMGIINVTPDSFSNDGIFGVEPQRACVFAQEMVKNGADILDIGGESSRPGSKRISAREELKRVLPLLKLLVKRVRVPISVDTVKSEVAHAALDLGACMVNDISALRHDKKMARLLARHNACVVLTHMKGTPATMQQNPHYADIMTEIILFLDKAIHRAQDAGIPEDKIIIDPGIGFGKTLEHNVEILRRLAELKNLGRPILVGLSRKWFIGKILNAEAHQRAWGTAAALGTAMAHGADIVRVHDVKEMKQVVKVCDVLIKREKNSLTKGLKS